MSPFEVHMTQEQVEQCQKLCADFLAGPWQGLKKDEFNCEPIKGGVCNQIFVCSNKKLESRGTSSVPEKVLVRKYGSPFVGRRGDMISMADGAVSVVAQILYDHGLGPKIFGVFEGGRIEQFIPNTPIPEEDKTKDEYLAIIMKKFVQIHDLEMPISKDPYWIFEFTRNWFEEGRTNKFLEVKQDDHLVEQWRQELLQFSWREHLEWLKERVPLVDSPEVFTHNDMQFPNVFLREGYDTLEEKLFVIDYENCSYGFRGYDLAFFIMQKSVDFTKNDFIKYMYWPEKGEREKLVSFFREEYIIKHGGSEETRDSLDHLMMEVDFFILLMCLMRASIVAKKCCQEMVRMYIELFHRLKRNLLQDHPFLKN
ncbi:choline kinase alpha-like isoform X1 [Brevipalpus obovatus]|uniref:choline kinase alpha-like isoform X1 n=1 Tax=Brevipalpus obovatus TaxID=246614 RepID=UPI003D9DCD94